MAYAAARYHFAESVRIDRSAAEVWAMLIDVPNVPDWEDSVLEVRQTSPGEPALGTTFVARRVFGWRETLIDCQIIGWEAHRLVTMELKGGLVRRTSVTYAVAPTSVDSCQVTYSKGRPRASDGSQRYRGQWTCKQDGGPTPPSPPDRQIQGPGYDAPMTSLRSAFSLSLAVMFVLAACGSGTSSPVPRPTTAASLTGATPPSQTDTEWGRIWDTLPSGFPTYPGSTPGEETSTGPASANLVVQGLDAKGITTLLQTLLQQAGYATEGLSGPLEDGSYVLDMTGPATGCKVQVSAAPTGSVTILTILYGASCPH